MRETSEEGPPWHLGKEKEKESGRAYTALIAEMRR